MVCERPVSLEMVRTCLSQNLEIMVQIGEARLLECNRECWIGVACWGNDVNY